MFIRNSRAVSATLSAISPSTAVVTCSPTDTARHSRRERSGLLGVPWRVHESVSGVVEHEIIKYSLQPAGSETSSLTANIQML
ncbi:hypothetical protein E2C01_027280 [Portunus trituberculatus]|uniref:Uncharacterized protein n=1 Tax=Portunus trituberculatus TaxID=210409 RepID=A0A5B7ELI4_PORTR|nr:hypothetical protein [Portunus trituberculatus]